MRYHDHNPEHTYRQDIWIFFDEADDQNEQIIEGFLVDFARVKVEGTEKNPAQNLARLKHLKKELGVQEIKNIYADTEKYTKLLDEEAALKACSWGKFQILGDNHRLCGHTSVLTFVEAMNKSEYTQLEVFIQFIQNSKLADTLQTKNWASFAYHYNGPRQDKGTKDITDDYSYFLEKAYKKLKALRSAKTVEKSPDASHKVRHNVKIAMTFLADTFKGGGGIIGWMSSKCWNRAENGGDPRNPDRDL